MKTRAAHPRRVVGGSSVEAPKRQQRHPIPPYLRRRRRATNSKLHKARQGAARASLAALENADLRIAPVPAHDSLTVVEVDGHAGTGPETLHDF